jgi:23S rRNA pseudouridine1911/1915/1917 synthase
MEQEFKDNIELEETDTTLYEHHYFKVDPKQTPLRIDKFLMDKLMKVSRNKIQKAAKENYVFVNEVPVNPNYKVQPGDVIKIAFPYEKFANEVIPQDIPLDIVYEDDQLLIINKQAGMVVHPGIGNYDGTLVNAIKYYLKDTAFPIKEENTNDRPGIVHRIDKDTTGLMVVVKTEEAMNSLSKQFYDHTIEREYQALVWGNFDEYEGTINAPIGRHDTARYKMQAKEDGKGKKAITHYKVEEDLYYVTLVRCSLETGRTHQIRVHMQFLGHPLFGDWRYEGDKIWKGTIYSKYKRFVENCLELMPRQALHAHKLGFIHPKTGKKMVFEQPLPKDFNQVLERWRIYVKSKSKS